MLQKLLDFYHHSSLLMICKQKSETVGTFQSPYSKIQTFHIKTKIMTIRAETKT